MREVSVGELETCIINGIGDPVRLQSIIDSMKKGVKLNDSDSKYLESLLKGEIASSTPDSDSFKTKVNSILITTTPNIEGSKIVEYIDIVSGQAVMGANIFRDWFASVSDVIGGRSGQYEDKFRDAKDTAIYEMCEQAVRYEADAVVGVTIDYEMVRESMMMVSVDGTAVKIVTEKN